MIYTLGTPWTCIKNTVNRSKVQRVAPIDRTFVKHKAWTSTVQRGAVLAHQQAMHNFTAVAHQVLQSGGHVLLFCSRSKFWRLYQLFSTLKKEEENYDDEKLDITRTVKTYVYCGAEPIEWCPCKRQLSSNAKNVFPVLNAVVILRNGKRMRKNLDGIDYDVGDYGLVIFSGVYQYHRHHHTSTRKWEGVHRWGIE